MNKWRRLLGLVLAACCLLAAGCGTGEAAETMENARESVTGMKIGWNLGNTFDAWGDWIYQYTKRENKDYETAWGNPETPDTLMKKLKGLGFESVRIPITWRYHFDGDGKIDEKWIARIQEVVDQAMEADLYCIINIHHDTGAEGWLRAEPAVFEEKSSLYAELWRQIAERFRDYPGKLLFESFNEMLDNNNEWNNPGQAACDTINAYNQLFVDTVRKTGGNNAERNLIVNTYAAANTEAALKGFILPEDTAENHLIAEVHFYVPYHFVTDEGVTWTTPISQYSAAVEKEVDSTMARIGGAFGETPWIIGEFATDDKGNTEDRVQWYTRVVEDAKQYGAPCFIWDNGKGFNMGHIDRTGEEDPFPEIVEACIRAAERE